MRIPENFYNKMDKLLKDESEEFFKAFDVPLYKGIRANTLKISIDEFRNKVPFAIEHTSWCDEGFYLMDNTNERPGRHPYHYCGLYYLQEPSAMIPVEALDIKPGDKVLDISAAPGGKSTQIGAKLKNKGLLVANDINPKRTIALAKNIQIAGIKNSLILNYRPEKLPFNNFFDKILVDAPCSGEGMLKKDYNTLDSNNEDFHLIQCNILESVSSMLKPGGKLVYSTCTFSPEENEGTIKWFLDRHTDFKILDININGLDRGRYEWIDGQEELEKARRVWPHKVKGEGHFVALLEKRGEACYNDECSSSFKYNDSDLTDYCEFADYYNLNQTFREDIHRDKDSIYLIPKEMPDITGMKVVNNGLYLGNVKNRKFIPSQELASSLCQNEFGNTINLKSTDIEAIKYLKGETLNLSGNNGWCLVLIDGFSAGWGKQENGMIKNYYKKQWRMM